MVRQLAYPVSWPDRYGELLLIAASTGSHGRRWLLTRSAVHRSGRATCTWQPQTPERPSRSRYSRSIASYRSSSVTGRPAPPSGAVPLGSTAYPTRAAARTTPARRRYRSARSSASVSHGRVAISTWYRVSSLATSSGRTARTFGAAATTRRLSGSTTKNSSSTPNEQTPDSASTTPSPWRHWYPTRRRINPLP